MRKLYVLAAVVMTVALLTGGCAKKKVQRVEARPTLLDVKVDKRKYLKKTTVILTNRVAPPAGPEHGRRFMQQFKQTLLKRADNLLLVSENDSGLATFVDAWADAAQPAVVQDIARTARQAGFQTLLRVNLLAVQPSTRKQGIWILRRERFYMTVKVILDVLDPFTAAKMASIVTEKKVKINELDFEAYNAGEEMSLDELDKAIDRLADDLGRQAAEFIDNTPWRCTVVNVQGDRLVLAAGADVGVATGDRFSVFDGHRQVQSKTGEVFMMPGFKLGGAEITAVNGPTSEAALTAPANVQSDDFVVPTR